MHSTGSILESLENIFIWFWSIFCWFVSRRKKEGKLCSKPFGLSAIEGLGTSLSSQSAHNKNNNNNDENDDRNNNDNDDENDDRNNNNDENDDHNDDDDDDHDDDNVNDGNNNDDVLQFFKEINCTTILCDIRLICSHLNFLFRHCYLFLSYVHRFFFFSS